MKTQYSKEDDYIIWIGYAAGRTPAELAQELGRSESSVRNRYRTIKDSGTNVPMILDQFLHKVPVPKHADKTSLKWMMR